PRSRSGYREGWAGHRPQGGRPRRRGRRKGSPRASRPRRARRRSRRAPRRAGRLTGRRKAPGRRGSASRHRREPHRNSRAAPAPRAEWLRSRRGRTGFGSAREAPLEKSTAAAPRPPTGESSPWAGRPRDAAFQRKHLLEPRPVADRELEHVEEPARRELGVDEVLGQVGTPLIEPGPVEHGIAWRLGGDEHVSDSVDLVL